MFYQLKVTRKNTKPPVWRRVLVPSDITFAQLAVILEELLELPLSQFYEFEFFSAKIMIYEWHSYGTCDFQYFYRYLNGPDTFINKWMESEKTCSFSIFGKDSGLPAYKIEMEQTTVTFVTTDADGRTTEGNFPTILKEVSPKHDPYWNDASAVNERMQTSFALHTEPARYLNAAAVAEEIRQKKGIGVSKKQQDRDIHTKESLPNLMQTIVGLLEGNLTEAGRKVLRKQMQPRRKATLHQVLETYDKNALLQMAAEEEIQLNRNSSKEVLLWKLEKHLLSADVMKVRMLLLSDTELNMLELLLNSGARSPEPHNERTLENLRTFGFAVRMSDGTIQACEDVGAVYSALAQSGYTKYHQSARWLLECIWAANRVYGVTPVSVLYRMYEKNKTIPCDEMAVGYLLKQLPEKYVQAVRTDEFLIAREMYENGSYEAFVRERQGAEFYIPDSEEIRMLSKDGYPSKVLIYRKLNAFFTMELNYSETEVLTRCQSVFMECLQNRSAEENAALQENANRRIQPKQKEQYLQLLDEILKDTEKYVPHEAMQNAKQEEKPQQMSLWD